MTSASHHQVGKATRDALHDTLQEMDVVSDEITRLQHRLHNLEYKAAIYRSTLSPWTLLPDDMLIEIFEHCLPPDGRAAMSIKAAPLLITFVCKRWRDIALAINSLWAKVHFVMPISIEKGTPSAGRYHKRVQALSDWLLRSGSLPITITMSKQHVTASSGSQWSYDMHGRRAFRGLFRILSAHASRLQYVRFPTQGDDIVPVLKGSSSEPLVFLSLEKITSPSESVLTQWPLAQAPNLRSISLMLRNVPSFKDMKIGPWSQLTHLRIYDWCSPHTLLGLLSQCPSLVDLYVLCGAEVEEHDLTHDEPFTSIPFLSQLHTENGGELVTLPHLLTLNVGGLGTNALTRALQVPALKHAFCGELQQSMHDDDGSSFEFPLFSISTVNPRGSFMLHSLALRMPSPNPTLTDSLVAFLRTQDELRTLKLEMDMWNGTTQMTDAIEHLLQELMIKGSPLVRLPSLEELELSGIYDGTADATLDCIRSRVVVPEHALRRAKVRLHRVSVEMARRANQYAFYGAGDQTAYVSRDCLVKMREFLKLPEIASSLISIVVCGVDESSFATGNGSHTVDPFQGLEDTSEDQFHALRLMGGRELEVGLEDFFQEDIMTSWSIGSEDSSEDESS